MPAQEVAFLTKKAVLWTFTGYNAYGQPTVSATPEEIDVRWNDKKAEAIDPQGNTIRVDATAVVDIAIAVGSEIWLGTLSNWYGTGSGGDDSEVRQVTTYNETLDLRGREVFRTIGIMRRKNVQA